MEQLVYYCEDPRHPCRYERTSNSKPKPIPPRRDMRTPDMFKYMGDTDAMRQRLYHSNNPPHSKQEEPANRMRTIRPEFSAYAETPYYHPRRYKEGKGRQLQQLQFPIPDMKHPVVDDFTNEPSITKLPKDAQTNPEVYRRMLQPVPFPNNPDNPQSKSNEEIQQPQTEANDDYDDNEIEKYFGSLEDMTQAWSQQLNNML